MSKELEKRLLNTWPKIAAGPATTAQRELIDEAAAELKAQRERIEVLEVKNQEYYVDGVEASKRAEQAEAARDKALADVDKLRRALKYAKRFLKPEDHDTDYIAGTLKETSGEQDG